MRTATLAIPVSCPDRMFLCLAEDGTSRTLDLDKKWSSAIFEELMDAAGGERWQAFKTERKAAGKEPVFPIPTVRTPLVKKEGVAAALP